MKGFSAEAVVLKQKNYGEADRLLLILTANHGKLWVLAKGVRKITSRRSGNLDLLNQVKVFLTNKNLPILSEVATLNTFPSLKKDLKKLAYAYKLTELADHVLENGQMANQIYQDFVKTLKFIEVSSLPQAKLATLYFELKILLHSGYRPEFSKCIRCGEKLSLVRNTFSLEAGGVVEKNCSVGEVIARPISVNAIKTVRFLQNEGLENVSRFKISETLFKEVDLHLHTYAQYVLEKDFRSDNFIRVLEKMDRLAYL